MDASVLTSKLAQLNSRAESTQQFQKTQDEVMSSTSMELLYRNAQLETELRIVKEQLAQAHQSTHYLLRLMSGSSDVSSVDHGVSDTTRLQYESTKKSDRKDSVADALNTSWQRDPEAQLISFDSNETLLDNVLIEKYPYTPSLQPQIQSPRHGPVHESIGYGILNSIPSESSFALNTEEATSSSSSVGPRSRNQPGFTIKQRDGTTVFIPTPTTGTSSFSSSSPAPEPLPFLGYEHRSLAGKAFVWVDMTPEELTEVVARYAKEHPRHTAEEYRSYFEDVTRPAYYRQEKEKEAVRPATNNTLGSAQLRRDPKDSQGQSGKGGQSDVGVEDTVPSAPNDAEDKKLPDCDQDAADAIEQMSDAIATEIVNSPVERLPQGLAHLMHAIPAVIENSQSEALCPQEAHLGPMVAVHDYAERGLDVQVNVPTPPSSKVDSALPEQPTDTELEPKRHSVAINPITSSGYQPPRLYNPAGLHNAKLLQADFENGGPIRSRRGREHPLPIIPEGAKDLIQTDRKAPGSFRRPPRNAHTTYTSFPYTVSSLFATPAESDLQPCRTVLISNIPAATTLVQVLDHVHSGTIFSAILCDTAGMRTNPPLTTNSAMITFTNGHQAQIFIQSTSTSTSTTSQAHQPLSKQLNFHLLPTISRPLPATILTDMQQQNLTRILFIHDEQKLWTPDEVVLQLRRNGVRPPLRVEEHDTSTTATTEGEDNNNNKEAAGPAASPKLLLLLLHFASMTEAKEAQRAVDRDRLFFEDMRKGFFADPCGKPGNRGEESEEEGGGGVEEGRVEVEVEVDERGVGGVEEMRQSREPYQQGIHSEASDCAIMFEG